MRLVITCNGPGETAGWLRPLLREIYARAPETGVHVFYVPDDYATGREPELVRAEFPQAHVYDAKTYLRVAFGGRVDAAPEGAEAVLYLGGDLMHAARLHKRFGGAFAAYKFARPRYAKAMQRAFAVDERNAQELRSAGVPDERVRIVGNLAIDGALIEAALPMETGAPTGGVLIMPGSRPHEVRHLVPFFFTVALRMQRERPDVPIAFGISPFTPTEALRRAVEDGGDPRFYARRGMLQEEDGALYLASGDGVRFPVLRRALAAAQHSRLAVTIPGTKVIELASLGVPVLSCTPLNAPELAAINGPLTYLDRIPLLGAPLKRTVVTAVSRKHRFHTQPNIDAQRDLVRELHGTLTPGRVARVAAEMLENDEDLQRRAQALRDLYREHVGAAGRVAGELLRLDVS